MFDTVDTLDPLFHKNLLAEFLMVALCAHTASCLYNNNIDYCICIATQLHVLMEHIVKLSLP